jgi:hypothetical protein
VAWVGMDVASNAINRGNVCFMKRMGVDGLLHIELSIADPGRESLYGTAHDRRSFMTGRSEGGI